MLSSEINQEYILIHYIDRTGMPVDPVCGIELDESLALLQEYDGKKDHFCCNGCKTKFKNNPELFLIAS